MKKLLIAILIILPLTASAAWYNPLTWFQKSSPELSVGGPAAGTVNYTPTLVPLNDSLWDIGTSTKAYRQFWIDEICFTGDSCETAWPVGGGGSGGGTWSTTTSAVAGQLINYPNNNDDIVTIGSNSTTTAEFYYDPNVFNLFVKSASSTIAGPLDVVGNFRLPLLSQGFAYIGSGGKLNSIASSSILLQDLGGAVTDAQVPDSITVTLASTATALAANGANCSAGSFPLGVDASGAVETCTDAWTEAENTSAGYVAGTRALTVAGTANQITSSAGAQNLTADRTWTLSFPNQMIFPQYASSTLGFSTPYASSTFQTIGTLTFGGVTGSAWTDFCTSITGSADLCDGSDASGGGGSSAFEIATTSDIALSQVAYINKTAGRTTLASVATSSVTINAPLTSAGTPGYVIGGSGWTLDVDDIGAADLASADFGSFTCNGTTCSLDSGSVSTTNIVGGSTNTVLQTNGADIVAWAKLDLANQVTGTLPIANGGTATTTGRYQGLYFFGGDVFRQASTTGLLDYDPTRQLFTTKYSSSTDYSSFQISSTTDATASSLNILDFFKLPIATAPTLGVAGRLALDTTSNNLVLATSTNSHVVVASATTTLYSFSLASTSPDFISGGIIEMPSHPLEQVVTAVWCKADGGTSKQIFISDGTNDSNTITCTTTGAQYAITSNNVFTAGEQIRTELVTTSGSVDYVVVRWLGYRVTN